MGLLEYLDYTTHNEEGLSSNNTSYQGRIVAHYQELVDIFGESAEGDQYKVDAQWIVLIHAGSVALQEDAHFPLIATIYNYKDGVNYCGAEGKPVEYITDWHVGGRRKKSLTYVQQILDEARK